MGRPPVMLVGVILLDMHDEWVAAERRHLSEGSMAKLYATDDAIGDGGSSAGIKVSA